MTLQTILKTSKHEIKSYKPDQGKEKIALERLWRDCELIRTDELIKLPDYPVDLLAYRAALRVYPEQVDFPNGDRPSL